MNDGPRDGRGPGLSRRGWLAATIAGCLAGPARGAMPEPIPDREELDRQIAAVEEIAWKAGLGRFRYTATRNYLGIGNAPDQYRREAVAVCEAFAPAFFRHFEGKGFDLVRPRRLTVVTLADQESYLLYQGLQRDNSWGTFQPRTNRVLVYDLRGLSWTFRRPAEWENLRSLIHEAAHQLVANTAMIDMTKDHPYWLVEGLACYCETFRPGSRPTVGGMNHRRLNNLFEGAHAGELWVEIERLVSEDRLFKELPMPLLIPGAFEGAIDHRPQAYGQGWLLVDLCLSEPTLLPRFRAYLKALKSGESTEPAAPAPPGLQLAADGRDGEKLVRRRIEDVRRSFGSLSDLELAARRRLQSWPYYRGPNASDYGASRRGASGPFAVRIRTPRVTPASGGTAGSPRPR